MGDKATSEGIDPVVIENARIGYRVAVNLWTYQGSLNWNRFNVMLAANSIIVAVLGVVSNQSTSLVIRFLLPVIGLFLCVVWVFLTSRGFDYHRYWSAQALALEREYLSDPVRSVSQAQPTEEGASKVQFSRLSQLPVLSDLGRQKGAAFAIVGVFASVYTFALVYNAFALLLALAHAMADRLP